MTFERNQYLSNLKSQISNLKSQISNLKSQISNPVCAAAPKAVTTMASARLPKFARLLHEACSGTAASRDFTRWSGIAPGAGTLATVLMVR
jgi:hypothetical protein